MMRPGTRGGTPELLAAAAFWRLAIVVLNPGKTTVVLGTGKVTVWLEFSVQHYRWLSPTVTPELHARRHHFGRSIAPSCRCTLDPSSRGGGRGESRSRSSESAQSFAQQPHLAHVELGEHLTQGTCSMTEPYVQHLDRQDPGRCSLGVLDDGSSSGLTLAALEELANRLGPAPHGEGLLPAKGGVKLRKQLRRQAIVAAAPLRAATGPGLARSAAVDARAARIREAAASHSWIHSPAVLRVEDLISGRRTWRCGRCEVALPSLTAALPIYRSRGMCGKAARTLAPSLGTRRQIVDALGLMLPKRAARAERHLPAAGTAGSRPYRSADVFFRCECGWGPPSGSRRVSTLVAAH